MVVFGDIVATIISNFAGFFDLIADAQINGVPLITLLLGGSLLLYISWSLLNWIVPT